MAFIHGKDTEVSLDGNDLSAYVNESELGRTADSHDVTTYGKDAHVFQGGLLNGTASMSGIYDDTAMTGPRAVIEPLVGTVVELIRRPASGVSDTVDVLVTEYVETAPVADMVQWSVSLQLSDAIVVGT